MNLHTPSGCRSTTPSRSFYIAAVLLSLYFVATGPVWLPVFMRWPDLDFGWAIALWSASSQGLDFGERVIFTYGPLGHLCTPYYSPTDYSINLLLRALLGIWAGVAAAWLAFGQSRHPQDPPRWVAVAGLCLLAVGPLQGVAYDIFTWLLPVLLLLMELSPASTRQGLPRILRALGLVLFAVLSLGKFTTFMFAVPVLLAITANRLLTDRKSAWEPMVFPVALLITWAIIGQPFSALPAFIKTRLMLSSAYSTGISGPYPLVEILCVAASCVSLSLWLVIAARAFKNDPQSPDARSRAVFAAAAALLVFIAYKAGVVRPGPSTSLNTIGFMLVSAGACMLVPMAPATVWRRSFKPALVAFALAIFLVMGAKVCAPSEPDWWGRLTRTQYYRAIAIGYIATQPDLFQSINAAQCQPLIQEEPLPAEFQGKTTDVVDLDQQLLVLVDVQYTPRPTLQDYLAPTPQLSSYNTSFYRGPDAPQQLFMSRGTVDNRFPLISQGPLILEILARYRPVGAWRHFTVLHRATDSESLVLEPAGHVDIVPGQPVAIPSQSGPLWAQLQYDVPLSGRAWNFIHRTPRMMLTADCADGRQVQGTAFAQLMQCGFLLSPITTPESLPLVPTSEAHRLQADAVTRLTVTWDDPAWIGRMFEAPMRLNLYRIKPRTSP